VPVARLFVGNVSFQADEDKLTEWFAQLGVELQSVDLIRDRTSGQLRGFGFVELAPGQEPGPAIDATNGQRFLGRPLVIDQARNRRAAPPRHQAAGAGQAE
jgi:RNA recognition motif-containing protein